MSQKSSESIERESFPFGELDSKLETFLRVVVREEDLI